MKAYFTKFDAGDTEFTLVKIEKQDAYLISDPNFKQALKDYFGAYVIPFYEDETGIFPEFTPETSGVKKDDIYQVIKKSEWAELNIS